MNSFKDAFHIFAISLAKRKTKSQRKLFLQSIQNIFLKLNYSVEVQDTNIGKLKNQTIIVGDINKAERIYMGIYDIPFAMLLPFYKFTPLDMEMSKRKEILNMFFCLTILALSAFGSWYFIQLARQFTGLTKIGTMVLSIIILFLSYKITIGKNVYFNFSRNSGLALMYSLAKIDQNAAYIFADNSSVSYLGLKEIIQKYTAMHKKEVILFDCLGKGKTLFVCHSKKAKHKAECIRDLCLVKFECETYKNIEGSNNIMNGLDNVIVLEFGEKIKDKIIVNNMRNNKDNDIDLDKLEYLLEVLTTQIQER